MSNSDHWIDLRSDTVTQPSEAMLAAMGAAPVGDDVYADDPTVNRLQEYAADLFGFEAGLFAPSGTQTNLIALMTHCGRGDEYLVGQEAHTYKYEGGGAAVLGSIQPQPIANQPDGSTSRLTSSRTTCTSRAPACWRWRTRSVAVCWARSTSPPRLRSRMRKAWPPTWTARASATPP
jgi:hypothetical protein